VGLARNRCLEIVRGVADRQSGRRITSFLKVFKMAVGMACLAFGSRAEYCSDIVIAFNVGFLGEIQITAISLALAGECGLEVGFSLCACETH
jgi:hypothetical protein